MLAGLPVVLRDKAVARVAQGNGALAKVGIGLGDRERGVRPCGGGDDGD